MGESIEPGSRRVLIVDDHVESAEVLGMVVQSVGAQVRLAHDGPAALALAREFLPRVIFLDLNLPGLDGYEVARRLRVEPETARSVVIALTGWARSTDEERSLREGFEHHLVKPVEVERVRRILETVFSEAEVSGGVERRKA